MNIAAAEAKEQNAQRAEQRRSVVDAYAICFGSAAGKVVLEDLQTIFNTRKPRFIAGGDALLAAVTDGQCQVTGYIEQVIDEAKALAGTPPIKP